MTEKKVFKKPLTIRGAIKAGLFTATLIAMFVFAVVSSFTPLWPYGCVVWFILVAGFFSFVFYDMSQPDDEPPTDDSIVN